MTEKKLRFLVVFFSRNRRLLITLGALAAIVLAVWLIVAFTNWLVAVNQEELIPWTVVYEEVNWQGTARDGKLPRFFVAGGTAYDRKILVDGWGMSAEALIPVDYMEDLGIHLLFGEVSKITYKGQRLQINIDEKASGYKLITISKGHFYEGDLQIVFADSRGTPISYEEEYIYSVPLNYTLVERGEAESKAAIFMEVLDTETLPVLTSLDLSLINKYPNSILLYIQGGEVATIQRNENTVRVYVNNKPIYQIIALAINQLQPGQNSFRLIDSSDLSVQGQIIISLPGK